jgi:hypothetical protein
VVGPVNSYIKHCSRAAWHGVLSALWSCMRDHLGDLILSGYGDSKLVPQEAFASRACESGVITLLFMIDTILLTRCSKLFHIIPRQSQKRKFRLPVRSFHRIVQGDHKFEYETVQLQAQEVKLGSCISAHRLSKQLILFSSHIHGSPYLLDILH